MEELKVWNCTNLRMHIFSFIRKKPSKECFFCKCVLVWDKKIKDYMYIPNINNYYGFTKYYRNKISCLNCWTEFLQHTYSFQ